MRRPSLFWRTFLLILLLIAAILLAWLQSFRLFDREPRAQQIAQQIVSIVNVTRSALLYSEPALRRELLLDLADNEGIRIVPLERSDTLEPLPDSALAQLTARKVLEQLGPQTRLAESVNGVAGIWVSFDIDEDAYWVFIDRDPLARRAGTQWIRWAAVSMLLSLLAAVAITRVVNRPLKRLSDAAREFGAGRIPPPLPERGPAEIRAVNQSFNRMVEDLNKLEQDRAVLLAGISHDLRTPLARLRLEIEMSGLPEDTRTLMTGDIEQMDSIVRQFLDYARPEPQQPKAEIDLSALVAEAIAHSRLAERAGVELNTNIPPGITVEGHRTELARALDNLLTNADRYGSDPDSGRLRLDIGLRIRGPTAVVDVADRGPGIPADEIDRLRRPFERGEAARTGGTGAGLGLAIVDRIARLHGGRIEIAPNPPRGLRTSLVLPRAAAV